LNLSKNIKVTQCLAYASGTAVREGAILDMSGWDGVIAVVCHATIAASAVGDVHWEQDSAAGGGTMADLAGTAIAVAADDDDQTWVMDLYKPTERYVRAVVTKDASNAQAESVTYIQYRGSKLPVADAGADEYELHVSPAEGTK
jgi:hypothetical protein